MLDRTRSVQVAAVVVVGVLVVLSGCAGVLDGNDDGETSPDPSETPPGVANATLPPGVNETSLVDADALIGAHVEAMAAEGFVYTYEHRRVKTFPNDTTIRDISVHGEVRATANLTALREEADRDRPRDETTNGWTNATGGFERVVADGTTYERRSSGPSAADTVHYLLMNVLGNGEWNLSTVADGGEQVVLVADGSRDGTPGSRMTPSVAGRLVVDGEGRIRELNVTARRQWYESDVGGRIDTRRTFTYEVTAVGNVSVSRPGWVDEARNATG